MLFARASGGWPPGGPRRPVEALQAGQIGSSAEVVQVEVRRRDRCMAHPGLHRADIDTARQPEAGGGVSQVVDAAAPPGPRQRKQPRRPFVPRSTRTCWNRLPRRPTPSQRLRAVCMRPTQQPATQADSGDAPQNGLLKRGRAIMAGSPLRSPLAGEPRRPQEPTAPAGPSAQPIWPPTIIQASSPPAATRQVRSTGWR